MFSSVFEDAPEDQERERPSPDGPRQHLVGLHAKVFAFEEGNQAQLFVGSANATDPAFHNNVEILAELRGPVAELGIDRLCDGNGDEPGLCELFTTYPIPGNNGPTCPNGCGGLDSARRAIARIPIEGTVSESREGWAVMYRSTKPLPARDRIEIHCRPLTTPGNRRRITPAEPFEVCFETSLEHISGFLAFELRHECGEETGFVVPVPLEGLPENRDQRVLIALLGNAERFMRYLLALLYEGSTQGGVVPPIETIDRGESDHATAVSFAVLEQMLSTMRRDPSKLLALHPLVSDLKADNALPPGFAQLWEAIHEVAVEGTGTR